MSGGRTATGAAPVSAGEGPEEEVAGHLLALASLPDVGPAALLACLADPGPEAIWAAVRAGRGADAPALRHAVERLGSGASRTLAEAAQGQDPSSLLVRHRALGCEVVVLGSARYPACLAGDPAPPPLLLVRGDRALLGTPAVAIVGTRNATAAGLDLARELGRGLSARGIAVVSGLALGIDGAAHRGVLEVAASEGPGSAPAGRPIGVVATGPDRCYPSRHAGLQRSVAAHGVLISETPIGGRPLPWRFPARNRLIAALAEAVVVVESRVTGGSLSTVAEALARGRTVLAVPGHPSMAAAAGTNALLADGATIVRDLEDVLVAIGRGGAPVVAGGGGSSPPGAVADRPSRDARAVLRLLEPGPQTLEHVVAGSGLGLDAAALALAELEAGGRVVHSGGWYQRVARSGGHAAHGADR